MDWSIIGGWGWLVFFLWLHLNLIVYQMAHAVAGWALGIGVEVVSIGFGPRLVGLRIRTTDYRLSLIPFGGYTKYRGDILDVSRPDQEDSFSRLTPAQKILIASAGPLSTLLLAFLLLTGSWWYGREEALVVHETARIGWCRPGSALANAGLARGDEILAANYGGATVPIRSWRDLIGVLTRATGYTLKLDGRRGPGTIHLEAFLEKSALADLCHEIQPLVGAVKPNSPASAAGFQPADTITEVEGRMVYHWLEMESALFASINAGPLRGVKVVRQGRSLTLGVPGEELKKGAKEFGLQPPAEPARLVRKTLGAALSGATFDLLEMGTLIERLVFRKGEFSSALSGETAPDNGYKHLVLQLYAVGRSRILIFAAFLSFVLGLLNLVPLPTLNGGHIAMACIEAIRGRPLSYQTRERVQQIGFFVLLALMLFFIVRSC